MRVRALLNVCQRTFTVETYDISFRQIKPFGGGVEIVYNFELIRRHGLEKLGCEDSKIKAGS